VWKSGGTPGKEWAISYIEMRVYSPRTKGCVTGLPPDPLWLREMSRFAQIVGPFFD